MKQNKKLIGIIISLILVFGCVITLTWQESSKKNTVQEQTTQTNDQQEENKSEESIQQPEETTKQEENQETKTKTETTTKKETTQENKQEEKQSNPKTQTSKSQETTKQEQTSESQQTTPQETSYVTLSIDCQTILNHIDQVPEQYKGFIPSNGIILNSKKVKINEGDSVFDITVKVTKMQKIQLTQNAGYIQSVHNLPEKMFDGSGGWMYNVNGTYASVGCKEYKLKNGDQIQWRYTSYTGDLYS